MNAAGSFLLLLAISAVLSAAPPAYGPNAILPLGARQAAPLAPGMLASIYGQGLGPAQACHGTPDPGRLETPNPKRPHQMPVELQVLPKRLCEVEVRVGGIAAGLIYVQATQINFKMPQEAGVEGSAELQVWYRGEPGPLVRIPLGKVDAGDAVEGLAAEMRAALRRVPWERAYRPPAHGASITCQPVPPHPDLAGGLYGHAFHCAEPRGNVTLETFFYPAPGDPPALRLRRADVRLANAYPHLDEAVEQALAALLARENGPGAVPDHVYEIGAARPRPGLVWRTGPVSVFVHRNRNYAAPAGVREGVQLIAVRQELLEERATLKEIEQAFRTTAVLAPPQMAADLASELGDLYPPPAGRPPSEEKRALMERETRLALLRLLTRREQGDRNRQAAVLVAADELAARLGALLVIRQAGPGGETLTEAPTARWIRNLLAPYGVRYTGIGHYSGDLESDRNLLRRAATGYADTPWGQRAFLLWQRLSCSTTGFGCEGPNCFRAVVERGEEFLRAQAGTPFRKEQLYHLALAYETWWSLSKAGPGELTPELPRIDPASAEQARVQAIARYEELNRLAPGSPEARAGQLALPRLKLKLSTGRRTFFCGYC